jgi:predicted ATPase
MVKNLQLKNFKLFKETTNVPLKNINLLTGINGRGKSTVIQSLLLMKQSIDYDRTTDKIIFNNDDIKLGSFADVKNVNTPPGESIELQFQYADFWIKYRINEVADESMVGQIKQIIIKTDLLSELITLTKDNDHYKVNYGGREVSSNLMLYDLFASENSYSSLDNFREAFFEIRKRLSFDKIHYVSADRQGPQLYYEEKSLKGFYSVGAFGQDTVNVLYHSQDARLADEFIEHITKFFHVNIDEVGRTVGLQTEFWLNRIFNGVKIRINRVENAHLLTLLLSSDGTFNYYKSTNVGYGFTYVLPILVAGLVAKRGEILIVENPEAHLHPYAQSIIAKFLAFISLKGVQIIIESHSEHILNGLRISVFDEIISNTELNVLYFDRDQENNFLTVAIGDRGGIEVWPPDFFDQSTKDLNYLFGV